MKNYKSVNLKNNLRIWFLMIFDDFFFSKTTGIQTLTQSTILREMNYSIKYNEKDYVNYVDFIKKRSIRSKFNTQEKLLFSHS